jgi:hypothetical protein
MSEPIITKTCCTCKQIKNISNFHKCKSFQDGLFGQCKSCKAKSQKKYRNTKKGKLSHRKGNKKYSQTTKGKEFARQREKKWRNTTNGKIIRQHYFQTDRYKTIQKNYRKTEKGKIIRKQQSQNNYAKYPDKNHARDAVKYAVKQKILPNIKSLKCFYCHKQATVYHHYKGYEKIYYLTVKPVCYVCHCKLHKSTSCNRNSWQYRLYSTRIYPISSN